MERGAVCWARLDQRRPVLVVQADAFNRSRIPTVLAVALTDNTVWLGAPGNVLVPAAESGLGGDAVANVAHVLLLNRDRLEERSGTVAAATLTAVSDGLRLVLAL